MTDLWESCFLQNDLRNTLCEITLPRTTVVREDSRGLFHGILRPASFYYLYCESLTPGDNLLFLRKKVDIWQHAAAGGSRHFRTYLTESIYKVVLQKSIAAQIRQLIVYHYQHEEQVDEFVLELTRAKRLHDHFVWDETIAYLLWRHLQMHPQGVCCAASCFQSGCHIFWPVGFDGPSVCACRYSSGWTVVCRCSF